MRSFNHDTHAVRVIFGNNTLSNVKDEVTRLHVRHALVLSTPQQIDLAQRVAALLRDSDGMRVTLYSNATMHTPVEVTQHALSVLDDADCLVAVGGGSTTGLAKAIALRKGLPQIVVPTTYAGSEATAVVGQTENGKKTTTKDWAILPGTIIYDVSLTLTLPATMTCTSGLNAVAHAVEALYASNATPVTDMYAVRGIRTMLAALTALQRLEAGGVATVDQVLEARSDALEASWLCGTVLSMAQMGLHHKLCHTLGGQLNTPHAETHAILLPYSLLYNFATLSARQKALFNDAFDTSDGLTIAKQIQTVLRNQSGVPTSLSQLGFEKRALANVAKEVAAAPYPNPRPLEEHALSQLLDAAWEGEVDRVI